MQHLLPVRSEKVGRRGHRAFHVAFMSHRISCAFRFFAIHLFEISDFAGGPERSRTSNLRFRKLRGTNSSCERCASRVHDQSVVSIAK